MIRERVHGWDLRVLGRQASAHWPLGDVVLPRLGHAADRSVLWMAVAAALTATGTRRGRRAAGRGLGSVAVASLVANQVGKRVWPRDRPGPEQVPLVRRIRRVPTSGSFPSGHSASAAAFALGAALEEPRLAVPLGLTAAGVAWSRVYTGVHYPSDVFAGAALGVAAAGLVARVVPRPDLRKVDEHPPEVRLPERPTGRGVAIVVNHHAGPAARQHHLGMIRKALPDAEIIDVADGELMSELRKAVQEAEVLAVVGGDGTINAAAGVALEHGLPLAVFPGGTFNHFARDLEVRYASTLRAIRLGTAVEVHVAQIDHEGRRELFLNTASIGSYPEFVHLRRRWEGRVGKPVAAAYAMWRVLRRNEPEDVLVDGIPRRVGLLFVGNGAYQPRGFLPEWRPGPGDGTLDLRLYDVRGALPRARLVADLLFGRVSRSPDYVERSPRTVTIERAAPGLLARDGEIAPAGAVLMFSVADTPVVVYR